MNPRFLLTAIMIVMITGIMAQKPSVTLTFTADNNGQHVPLNSLLIENLTQSVDTTLYAPDTVLVLDYTTSINENFAYNDNSISLSQNFPNPMEGETTVSLWLPERNDILITISDVIGRVVVNQEFQLEQGAHTFSFYPGKESLYFLTVRADHQSRTIKMFNLPRAASVKEFCKLEYKGRNDDNKDNKSVANLNNFVFAIGHQLKYTASSALGDRTIIDTPTGNKTYSFQYGSGGAPCPGMPTVNDIDGNVYNTVLIGAQCWMKENLKTTTYSSGTSIPNVTNDSVWSDLTSGAYAWYDNDISWKNCYGGIYNWFTTVDTNGLCPTGWHVPTDEEVTILIDYLGGSSVAGGKLKESGTTHWASPNTGATNETGFTALPGGKRDPEDGSFSDIRQSGRWWCSTDLFYYNAYKFDMDYYHSYTSVTFFANKQYGFSVRCLRD